MKNFFYLALISFSFSNNFYLVNDFTIGYDSNPMKLSEDELAGLNDNGWFFLSSFLQDNELFLNKYAVNTKYLKLNSKIKTSFSIFIATSSFL